MKRSWALVLMVMLGFQAAAGMASASSLGQRRRPPRRTIVVVHKSWPLHRQLRPVIVRPVRVAFRVHPVRFLPAVAWAGLVVAAAPHRNLLVWEDGETLSGAEDWTEFTLNCDNSGRRLWLEVVAGRAQFDWAEIVFENGEAQVVDMNEWEGGPGHYEMLNFPDGRRVDHVRIIARAVGDQARVVLKMEK